MCVTEIEQILNRVSWLQLINPASAWWIFCAWLVATFRVAAIERPHQFRKWTSKPVLAATIFIPWVVCVSINLPVYFNEGASFVWTPEQGMCWPKVTPNKHYIHVLLSVGTYFPVAFTGIAYVTLFIRLALRQHRMPPTNRIAPVLNDRRDGTRLRHVALAKMLLASFVWYCLCVFPSPILTSFFPQLLVRDAMLRLWLAKFLVVLAVAGSPVLNKYSWLFCGIKSSLKTDKSWKLLEGVI